MAFCKKCGQDIGDASFCPKCGAAQGASPAAAAAAPAAPGDSATAGIDENVAGLLCYLFGWISGLIFLLIDKRPFVRFHGAQAIAFNIAVIPVWIVIAILVFIIAHVPVIGLLSVALFPLFAFTVFATWIFLMYKAFSHEKFKLPVIGDMVEKMIA
jgi:uncharacterized membrane protein